MCHLLSLIFRLVFYIRHKIWIFVSSIIMSISISSKTTNCHLECTLIFQLEIIDACVNYIEALQEQLNIRSPDDSNLDNAQNKKPMSTSIQSIMSAIASEQAENSTCLYSLKNTETDEYGASESSDDDFSEEEVDDDKNNNNESPRKEHCPSEESRDDDSNLTVSCSMEDELSPTKMTKFL